MGISSSPRSSGSALPTRRGRGEALDAFLSAKASLVWADGSHDCLMFGADWALDLTGSDPAIGYRGRYSTALGAQRLVTRAGGMEALSGSTLEPLGWRPRRAARLGDLALVRVLVPHAHGVRMGLIGAVAMGGGWWAAAAAEGWQAGRAEPVAIWRWEV